jgi:adenylate kinase family enzyme
MKRILITGNSGSGKSTLARQMSEILGIPAVHIDTLRFVEDGYWVERPKEEFHAKIAAAIAADEWIFEGCSTSTLLQRLERCDTIIFLDFSRCFCFYHAVKRRIQIRSKPRPELPKSCIDKIDKKSLKWILLDYSKRSRPRIIEMIYASGKPIHHFKKRKEVEQFMEGLQQMTLYMQKQKHIK